MKFTNYFDENLLYISKVITLKVIQKLLFCNQSSERGDERGMELTYQNSTKRNYIKIATFCLQRLSGFDSVIGEF